MDKPFSSSANSSNILLLGNILLANINVSGHLEYCINALIGGAIWMGYRLAVDYFERKRQTGKSE